MNCPSPLVVLPDPAMPLSVTGDHYRPLLTAAQSADRIGVSLYSAAPGVGPGLHQHAHEDETFYILEGEVTFAVGERRYAVGAGGLVFAPRGVPHTFKNCSHSVARFLIAITPPANFEAFYSKLLLPRPGGGPPTLDDLMERTLRHAPDHGIAMLGPNPL